MHASTNFYLQKNQLWALPLYTQTNKTLNDIIKKKSNSTFKPNNSSDPISVCNKRKQRKYAKLLVLAAAPQTQKAKQNKLTSTDLLHKATGLT